jgi:hypothetical protein
MDTFEGSPVLQKVLNDFMRGAVISFKLAAQRENKVLTGDMLNSIRAGALEVGKGFVVAHVYYSELLRIKDMKVLNYSRTPPLAAMREYVEKVGISNFGTVPGYAYGVKPSSETEAIERVAWGLKMSRKVYPNVKRGYRGLYNDPLKNEILPRFYDDMNQASGAFALGSFRLMFNQ